MVRLAIEGVVVWLVASQTAFGGVVITTDGSRLVGTIERLADSKLIIVTEIAGRLEIDATKVVAISSDEPVTVEFASGDRLVGTIDVLDGEASSVIHTMLGDVTFATTKVTAIWQPGADSPEVVALRKEAEDTRRALTPEWTLTLEAGGVRKEGNTDTLDAQGRFDLQRKTKDDLLKFFLAADYSEQDDKRSRNEYRGGMSYENMLTERAYWYTRLEMEYDEFENLDLRSTAAAGVGYYWLKKDDHEFKNRIGLGYRHESFNTGVTEDEAVLDLGLDYRVDIAPWLQFTQSTTYSPDFEEFDDYRLDLDTAVVLPLKSDILKLKMGVRNEYNSRPQPGIDRLDNTYYANLVLELRKPN